MLLANFVSSVQAQLDASTSVRWSADNLTDWTRQVIRELGEVLTRRGEWAVVADSDGQTSFDMPALAVGAEHVVVAGETCQPRSRYTSAWTREGGNFYHLELWDDGTNAPTLFLSPNAASLVVAGESVTVVGELAHDADIAADAALTVPDKHLHILTDGVICRAYQNTLADKMTDLNMDERDWMRRELQRVEHRYKNAVQIAIVGKYAAVVEWF